MGRRVMVILLLIAIVVTSAACGKKEELAPLQGNITELAVEFVTKLHSGDFASAMGYFDATMKKQLPERKLKETWNTLESQVGPFQGMTGQRTEQVQGYDVVLVTTQFRDALLDIRVVFDKSKRIAGLFFVPATEANYVPPSYAEPANFTEKEVTVGSGEWALPGTLTVPKGSGPFPAVILVHGSGPNDRDETIGPNKPFKDLALGLANQGIAVLRYEKRTREHAEKIVTLLDTFTVKEETIDDALAAVNLLTQTPGIDKTKVFVLGHSLGGTLAPRIGAATDEIAGLIILAGAVRPLEDLIVEQINYIAAADGTTTEAEKAEIKKYEQQVARIKDPNLSIATPSTELLGAPASYWLDLRGYNPAQFAASTVTDKPMFILQGERDYQVTMVDFNLWKHALADRSDVQFKSYPELNHLFLAGSGPSVPAEYQTAGNIPSYVITDIASWIKSK